MKTGRWLIAVSVLSGMFLLTGCSRSTQEEDRQQVREEVPATWKHLVKVEGQHYPIPDDWLSTPEGKIAHSLKLPDSVPKPVFFNLSSVKGKNGGAPTRRETASAYFKHLCETEAGEWILRSVEKVDGLYFARPRTAPSDQELQDAFSLEAPWIERHFQLMSHDLRGYAAQFVNPPFISYKFVEEPTLSLPWQASIKDKYVRFFGYTNHVEKNPKYGRIPGAQRFLEVTDLTPHQMIGIENPTAKYALTWRGIARQRDREFGVSGGEMLVYDRKTLEVLAVQRTFSASLSNRRGAGNANWLVAPTCSNQFDDIRFGTLAEFSIRVLKTAEPSVTGRLSE